MLRQMRTVLRLATGTVNWVSVALTRLNPGEKNPVERPVEYRVRKEAYISNGRYGLFFGCHHFAAPVCLPLRHAWLVP